MNSVLTEEQREIFQATGTIRDLLGSAKVIAIVGLSTESTKASNMVGSYLKEEGYRIVPVHPKAKEILGEKAYPNLKAIPFPVDLVDVFRPAEELDQIVADALEIGAKAVWMQLRIVNVPAGEAGRLGGLEVIMDKCMKMEHGRFCGALHWAGMNTEIISARRQPKRSLTG